MPDTVATKDTVIRAITEAQRKVLQAMQELVLIHPMGKETEVHKELEAIAKTLKELGSKVNQWRMK